MLGKALQRASFEGMALQVCIWSSQANIEQERRKIKLLGLVIGALSTQKQPKVATPRAAISKTTWEGRHQYHDYA